MSRRLVGVGASLTLVMSGLVLLASTPAVADPPTPSALAAALDAPADVTASVVGDPLAYAVTDVPFNDFPSRGQAPDTLGNTSYAVLSTGKASEVFSPTVTDNQPSTDLGAPGPDVTMLQLDVASSPTARCLLVDFSMGTEERVHTYTDATPSDYFSVKRAGDPTERAMNAGGAYITQTDINRTRVPAPVNYEVNRIQYWHSPGETKDPLHNTAESPRLPTVSAIDSYTSRDTAEVPLPAGSAQTVNVTIADAGNGSLDSVALVDRVRLAPSCSFQSGSMVPDTGLATGLGEIKGHRGVGNVLTVDPVSATADIEKYDQVGNGWVQAPVELRFRWYRSPSSVNCYSTFLKDWIAIADADRQSYVPTNLDKGRCLMALVTGTKDGFRSETFPTAGQGWYVTLPIQNGAFDGQRPAIACDQTPLVGSELSASVVDFVPKPDSYEYQWYSGTSASTVSTPISGATAKKYVLTSDEAGRYVTVRVTAQRSGFDQRSETSAACGPVGLLSMTTAPRPIIVGDGGLGQELSIATGDWVPGSPTFAYQWRLNNQNISGATRSTYTPKATDVGQQVTVAVTGAKTGFAPVTKVSDPITVGVGQLTSAVPYVAGTPVVNGTLTGTTTGWTTGTTLTYVWSAGGRVYQSGGSRFFVIPPAAAGRTVTLTVRGSKPGYGTAERSSAPTRTVAHAAMRTSAPVLSGTFKVGKTIRALSAGWSPSTARKTYRWMVNGKYVTAASTKTTLKLRKAWKGKRISVVVTGSATGYTTVARKSTQSKKVAK